MKGQPPRRWLEEEVAGLDIGDRQLSVAQVRWSRGQIALARAGCCPRPDDPSERDLSAGISRLWRECRPSTTSVHSAIQNRSLVVRHFDADGNIPAAELQSRLVAEARDILQALPQHISMDWCWTGGSDSGNAARGPRRKRNGIFLAMPRAELDAHLHLLQRAGLFPVGVEAACTAVASLYRALRPDRIETVCLIHLRHFSADVCIINPADLLYPRHIELTGDTADARMAALVPHLQEAIRYCRFKLSAAPVERIVFTGEAMAAPGQAAPDVGLPGLPVECWNPLDDLPESAVPSNGSFARARGASLAVALGLALRRGGDE